MNKEQLNDSLKKSDKNFNENCTHNKEQIIVDGVDVSGCKYLPYCNDKQGNCAYEPNYYFKQLARKTQECEELKEELNGSEKWRVKAENLNEKLDIKNTRYRKALEEIELTIKNLEKGDILTFPDFTLQENATMIINQCNQGYRDILDIINKAKEEE